jgi:hypothetical protein
MCLATARFEAGAEARADTEVRTFELCIAMSLFSRIFASHESVRRSAECLRKMADPSTCGVIPTLDAKKLFADPEFASSLERLQNAFRHLKIANVGSIQQDDR